MTDGRRNPDLNGVRLPDGRVVSWDEAYPRPWWDDPEFWRSARPEHKED